MVTWNNDFPNTQNIVIPVYEISCFTGLFAMFLMTLATSESIPGMSLFQETVSCWDG